MSFLFLPSKEGTRLVLGRLQLEIDGSQTVIAADDCLAWALHPDATVELRTPQASANTYWLMVRHAASHIPFGQVLVA